MEWQKNFYDIWEREKNGTLQFRFRNLWNQPTSDIAYIEELEKHNAQLLSYIEKTREHFPSIQKVPQESQLLISDTNDMTESEQMRERIKLLEEENQQLKRKIGHNARGAGRKPSQKRSDAIQQVKALIRSGMVKKR